MNNFHLNQLKYAFGLSGLLSFYGIIAMVVYLLPASTATYNHKIAIVAIVLLTLPFALIMMFVSSRRAKKKLKAAELEKANEAAGKEAEAAPVAANAPAAAVNLDMDAAALETINFLKSSNLGEGGKDAVYSLPWYIIAGSPKSGKSSLVLSSNLSFQTLPSQRQSEQKFIRPTGSIDWRVTSDAVFIDTAGRYQTEGADGEEWSSMLETIKKNRANRPIDGFILTVDIDKILKSDEREMEEVAKVLRARLDDAIQRLKVRFPVYLVFTNADSIEGFRDSFSQSKNENKTLVWGATIPIEKSDNAQALFDGEYEILHNSLMKRRLMRLSAPFTPIRQLRIFNFPLHFGSARRRFGSFVNTLFRPNPFSANLFLRGFYLTASPVGKVTGNAPQTVGVPFFTERLFRDVILRDKDLVKNFLASRARSPIMGWLLTVLGALLVIGTLAMAGVSLVSNRAMLADAEARGSRLLSIAKSDAGKSPLTKNEDQTREEINSMENLRVLLEKLDGYDRNGAPIFLRFGLYSGNKIYKQNLLPIYMNMVEQRFKTPALAKMQDDMRKFASGQAVANSAKLTEDEEKVLGKNYDLLKAYLMLSPDYKAKAESSEIVGAMKDYWTASSNVPPDMKGVAMKQLDFWAKQVDRNDSEYKFPTNSLDGKLVVDVQRKLQSFPAPYRYLSRKITEVSKKIDDVTGPTTPEGVLNANAGDTNHLSGTYRVPGAYTRGGLELMKVAFKEANEKLSEDDWVMGEEGKKTLVQTNDSIKIEDRYYRDYSDNWRNFVNSVQIKPYKNKDEAAAALEVFSSANSPIKLLLIEVAKNTNLSAPMEVPGWFEWAKSFFVKPPDLNSGTTQPEKDFRPLFAFVGRKEDPKLAPINKYLEQLVAIFGDIRAKSDDKMKGYAQEMADGGDPLKINSRETTLINMFGEFKQSQATQELANLMLQPITNLKVMLSGGAKQQLQKKWTEQILPAAKEIEKGYPFQDGANESDLTNLTAFLNPVDGKFSKFYDENLKRYFEEANGQLKLKDTSEKAGISFSTDFVTYLNNLFKLREGLFGGGAVPKFEYEFNLKSNSSTLVEISIDGQKTSSEGTGSLNGKFPGATSGESGVLMNISGLAPAAGDSTEPTSSETSKKWQGNWGLFRFVDAGGAAKQSTGEYQMHYTLGSNSLTATIKPRGVDLFDKTIFKNVKVPESFFSN